LNIQIADLKDEHGKYQAKMLCKKCGEELSVAQPMIGSELYICWQDDDWRQSFLSAGRQCSRCKDPLNLGLNLNTRMEIQPIESDD
jgi:hypothetical protein